MRFAKFIAWLINTLNDWIGKIISMLIFPMIFVLLWEVVMRYVFNRPTIWAHELSAMLYAACFLLGGAYALRKGAHVNVEIIYDRFPRRIRAAVDLVSWLFFYLFCGALLSESVGFAWRSTLRMELSSTVWGPPIWPIKLCVPLGACLILLQGLVKTAGDILVLFTGRDLLSEAPRKQGDEG